MVTGRVDGGAGDASFLADGDWSEGGCVYGSTVHTNFFTIAWLETGAVLTFSEVNLSLVAVAAMMRKLDSYISVRVVAAALMLLRNFDVNVGGGVFVFWSAALLNINVFSAARTVVMVLFSGDMNLLAVLLFATFARIEVGGEGSRFKLVCPSDALRFLW